MITTADHIQWIPLVEVAPLVAERVLPFPGKRFYLTTGGLAEDGIRSLDKVSYESRPSRADLQVKVGDLLYARMMETSKVLQISEEIADIIVSTGFAVHRQDLCCVNGRYLYHYLRSQYFQQAKDRHCTGATQKAITNDGIERMKFPLVPLPEQERIAEFLDRTDRLRRLRRYARELSDTYLQSVFLEMFGVAESRFPIVRMQEIASKKKHALSSGPFGSNLTSKHYTDAGVIVLRGLNISTGQLDLSDVKYISEEKAQSLARSEVRPGDVVIVAVGASGLACQIPESLPRAIMSQNFNKITPDTSKITPIYLEYCINSTIVQRQFSREITDTVRTFLSLTKLKDVEIPLPPLSLQQEFTCIVHKFEWLRVQQREAERQAEHLFQTLLHRAFRGEFSAPS